METPALPELVSYLTEVYSSLEREMAYKYKLTMWNLRFSTTWRVLRLVCRDVTSCRQHTYLLTPCSRVLLEKLTGLAASQEIPRIFGTRKFITVLASARHLSLSWANSIQSPQPPPTSWRSIFILSPHLRLGLPSGLFPSGLPTRTLCTPPPCLHQYVPSGNAENPDKWIFIWKDVWSSAVTIHSMYPCV